MERIPLKPVLAVRRITENTTGLVSGLRQLIGAEARRVFQNPSRLKEALRPRRWRQLIGVLTFYVRTGNRWCRAPQGEGFQKRVYSGYQEYLQHQRTKLRYLDLSGYETDYQRHLAGRLAKAACVKRGASVLCLGARLGAEVRAFREQGCFAVGVDLNPGEQNPCVLPGDFHQIQFPDGCVDVVFTNSLDHVFEAGQFIGEVKRVLKPSGLLILEGVKGRTEGVAPDAYASFWWNSLDDVTGLFEMNGFRLIDRSPFTKPWPGEQLCFEKLG